MKFEIIEKMIPTKFVVFNGVEFELSNLIGCLSQLLNSTEIDDHYGEYSLRSYELDYFAETKKLVEFGWVANYTGSRMADLYCVKDDESYKMMRDLLDKLYEIE
jgi:hypothetical protein